MTVRSPRKLIIDGQVFQTPALYRGMGKYSNELIKELSRQNKEKKYWSGIDVIYSTRLEDIEAFISQLGEWTRDVNFVGLDLMANEPGSIKTIEHNRSVIDEHLSQPGHSGVDFLILALFQSQICSVFPRADCRRLLLMHDLIPLTFQEIYLKDEKVKREYATKLTECFNTDLFLTVSQTVSNYLALYLGISRGRLLHIDGGPIMHGVETKPYPISGPFILMPTGNDVRKNNSRGILGFEKFNQSNTQYKLVITSEFLAHEISELQQLSPNVVFTGNISGPELNYLYENCAVVLFPTEDEGLGLPILEGVERNKPIACSDIPVFREMSSTAFNFFDPSNIDDIADAIQLAMQNSVPEQEYKQILTNFSWPAVVHRLIKGLAAIKSSTQSDRIHARLFSPNAIAESAAGWFGRTLAAELGYRLMLSGATPNPRQSALRRLNFLPYLYPFTYEEDNLFEMGVREVPIYVIDAMPESAPVMCRALAVPGIIILLDTDLRSLWTSAVDQGLLDNVRLELEKNIEQQTGCTSGLNSLLVKQSAVVTFSDTDHTQVSKVIKETKSSTLAFKVKPPRITVPYRTILSQGVKQVIHRNELSVVERVRYEQILRSKVVEGIPDNSQSLPDTIVAKLAQDSLSSTEKSIPEGFGSLADAITHILSKGSH